MFMRMEFVMEVFDSLKSVVHCSLIVFGMMLNPFVLYVVSAYMLVLLMRFRWRAECLMAFFRRRGE